MGELEGASELWPTPWVSRDRARDAEENHQSSTLEPETEHAHRKFKKLDTGNWEGVPQRE